MASNQRLHSILRTTYLLGLLLLLANCSGANFGGGSNSNRESASVPTIGTDPADDPTPVVPQSGDLKIYQVTLIDDALSLDGFPVTIDIAPQTSELLLFIHFTQPTEVILTGDTDAVAGLFLTSNTPLATSTTEFIDGTLFPTSLTATGFSPSYQAGAGLVNVIGQAEVDIWNNGVEVSQFASEQGPRKCFYLSYDSDMAVEASFDLDFSTGQTCIY